MAALAGVHVKSMRSKMVIARHHLSTGSHELMRLLVNHIILASAVSSRWILIALRADTIHLAILLNLCQDTLATLWRNQTRNHLLRDIFG